MIILDTNVLSALMQAVPEPKVVAWLDRQPSESVWITSITVFEARFGLSLLPAGRRRQALEAAFMQLLEEDLENRVLPFDDAAAAEAAALAARRQIAGRPVDFRDTQIAGIALARRAMLVTRNVRHFADLAIQVVNPWE
ncbi:type II toxin-antitoxin system VapC family toxin [Nevskia soli]|uniref:type II toxin-antitoxin system VapC family toxin n=1 Tax=Nevskia soli TaxID=418856 RepID=UPI0004A6F594|nr:type II toxin-antitoxin system VapC family toxin [Nevskia soli]